MNHKRRGFVIWQNKAAARKNRRQFRAATLIASAWKGTLVRMWAEEQLRLMKLLLERQHQGALSMQVSDCIPRSA